MNFLRGIADKAKAVTDSPQRQVGAAQPDAEGFLCPSCMKGFPSPELLQDHYEEEHIIEDNAEDISLQNSKLSIPGDHLNGHKSVISDAEDEEKSMYCHQIRALEESKHLLSSEVMTLRKQISESSEQSSINLATNRLAEKASELAAENVGLKAAVDEISGQKAAAEERLAVLEAEQEHRNSVDDAAVLRQELVSVQKYFDDYARDKERELNDLQEMYDKEKLKKDQDTLDKEVSDDAFAEVTAQKELLERELEKMKADVEKKQDLINSFEQNVETKSKNITESAKANEEQMLQLKDLHKKLKGKSEVEQSLLRDLEISRKEENKTASILEELSTELTETKEKNTKEAALVDELKAKVSDTERSLEEASRSKVQKDSELESVSQDLKSRDADIVRLSAEREELLVQIQSGEGANVAIQQLTSENASLQEKLAANSSQAAAKEKEAAELLDKVRDELGVAKAEASAASDKANRLAQEAEEDQKKIEKLNKKIQIAEEESKIKEEELNAQNDKSKKLVTQLEEQIQLGEKEVAGLKAEVEQGKNEHKNMSTALKSAQDNQMQLSVQLAEKSEMINKIQENNEKLVKELEDQKNVKANLNNDLKTQTEKIDAMDISLKDSTIKNEENTRLVNTLTNEKSLLEEERKSLQEELQSRVSANEELGSKLSGKETRISDMQSVISSTENKIDEMREAIEAAKGKEIVLLSTIEENQKTITTIEEEKSSVVTNLKSKQTRLEHLNTEIQSLQVAIGEEKQEKQQLEERICSLQADWEKEREAGKEELEQLRAARELLLGQVVELRTVQDEIIATNDAEKRELQRTHSSNLSSAQAKLEETSKNLEQVQSELSIVKSAKEQAEVTLSSTKTHLEMELSNTAEQLSKSEKSLSSLKKEISGIESERDDALSKRLELEAALGATSEEKKALLERCLAAEGEMEKGRNTNIELRRKLDDAQAAVHELGRENQSLQVELMKQAGRKWKDDSEVNECAACKSGFSLTNRKHHCRNCGEIFCTNCSAKQTLMSGYKKPQRVCEGCFSELASK